MTNRQICFRMRPALAEKVRQIARARSFSQAKDVSFRAVVEEACERLVRAEGDLVAAPRQSPGERE